MMTLRTIASLATLAALAVLPQAASALDQGFYIDLFTRILIFAIAALSLDLILGYGGLVSFGHAAYLGIGAYAVGISIALGLTNGFAHLGLAIGGSAVAAALIGLMSLRSAGTTFIMLTLAFAQMIYFLCESLNEFGGDNGLNIPTHSDFGSLVDLDDPVTLYYVALGVLAGALLLGSRLVESRFGMVLRAAKSNERRMAALGFPVFRYRLAAFVISGALCGLAGALLANQAQFLSPSIMHWTRSGEIMMMVILGGRGTLIGPVLGACAYIVLESALSGLTQHWQAVLGPILVAIVLLARPGLLRGLAARLRRVSAKVPARA
ncbi:MAG TPA: branched-chain amino acid ABC transporter permease [Acetobacteraceae bacterium]|nr:branched-chain amino acid ABC transporter permease [Acetobacteraceae bacterium]